MSFYDETILDGNGEEIHLGDRVFNSSRSMTPREVIGFCRNTDGTVEVLYEFDQRDLADKVTHYLPDHLGKLEEALAALADTKAKDIGVLLRECGFTPRVTPIGDDIKTALLDTIAITKRGVIERIHSGCHNKENCPLSGKGHYCPFYTYGPEGGTEGWCLMMVDPEDWSPFEIDAILKGIER